MKSSSQLCVVVPVFNEQKRFPFSAFSSHLSSPKSHFFLFVDDGSTDGSLELLQKLAKAWPEQVKVILKTKNTGKADAIREGIMATKQWKAFSHLAYWDADLSAPLGQISYLAEYILGKEEVILVMGSRKPHPSHTISTSWWRFMLGRSFSKLVNFIYQLPYYDTQCGAKILAAAPLFQICERPFITSWLVDLEIILRLKKDFPYKEILEIPLISWSHRKGSKFRVHHIFKIIYDIRKLYIYFKKKT